MYSGWDRTMDPYCWLFFLGVCSTNLLGPCSWCCSLWLSMILFCHYPSCCLCSRFCSFPAVLSLSVISNLLHFCSWFPSSSLADQALAKDVSSCHHLIYLSLCSVTTWHPCLAWSNRLIWYFSPHPFSSTQVHWAYIISFYQPSVSWICLALWFYGLQQNDWSFRESLLHLASLNTCIDHLTKEWKPAIVSAHGICHVSVLLRFDRFCANWHHWETWQSARYLDIGTTT